MPAPSVSARRSIETRPRPGFPGLGPWRREHWLTPLAVNRFGGILKRHHGDAFFTDARGAVEDDPPMCQVSSRLTSNLHPLRHRTHEPKDAGATAG